MDGTASRKSAVGKRMEELELTVRDVFVTHCVVIHLCAGRSFTFTGALHARGYSTSGIRPGPTIFAIEYLPHFSNTTASSVKQLLLCLVVIFTTFHIPSSTHDRPSSLAPCDVSCGCWAATDPSWRRSKASCKGGPACARCLRRRACGETADRRAASNTKEASRNAQTCHHTRKRKITIYSVRPQLVSIHISLFAIPATLRHLRCSHLCPSTYVLPHSVYFLENHVLSLLVQVNSHSLGVRVYRRPNMYSICMASYGIYDTAVCISSA